MEKILNIYQRLNQVMKEVKYIQKESKKVNNQYTFVSHDQVASALHDPMANNGIVMIPTILDLVQDGNKTTVKMDISFINSDNPSDKFGVVYYGYGIDAQDKGIGKAVSYAVKYALLKTFCLETGDDVERDNIDHSTKDQDEKKEMSEVIKKRLFNDISEEDYQWYEKYINAFVEKLKLTYETAIFKIAKKPDHKKDFYSWKSKQNQGE